MEGRSIYVKENGMLTSLALVFLVGLSMAAISQKLKLPRIIGMLLTGIVLGPFVLDFLDSSILGISSELRKMALVIILLKAGLSLNRYGIPSQGNRPGGNWLGSLGHGIGVWKYSSFRGSIGDSHYCAAWSHWDGCKLQKMSVFRELKGCYKL